MKRLPFDDVRDVPLPTDTELIPHLQMLLDGAFRRQLWVMFLDAEQRPLPVLIPTDLPAEPEPEDVMDVGDFLSCLALDIPGATVVLTYERPGDRRITRRDRRWLRTIREAGLDSGFPFRGPYLLVGSAVLAVPPDDYVAEEWREE